jgi:hypothetical protein
VITGDPAGLPGTAYDIQAVAAALRDGSSAVFILTQIYDSTSAARWRIYRISVSDLLSSSGGTLSQAVAKGTLLVVDEGTVTSTSLDPEYFIPFGLYTWDLLYEQVPDAADDSGDRLWAALGTPVLVTSGAYENEMEDPAYGSPTSAFQNAYAVFGFAGGVNMNMGAFDLTIEAANQAKRGVSLKRTMRKAQAPRPTEEQIAAAKAAKASKAQGGKAKSGQGGKAKGGK